MSHMPTTAQPSSGSGSQRAMRVVYYTATGLEGTSFSVPIGATLDSAAYDVIFAASGVANIPMLDMPLTGRTTTSFPVLLATDLTAGDTLTFVIYEAA